ncbi:Uncharacterised protein [Mycolicibacterium vanbaalenii]|uniref:O-antigen ligase-related domain-containing protein n=1 Tax=Mycolicibacterium vanbaalenii TaxID=110539 RepID=A0A5S9R2R0_MYCVN|nr:Uncharacterised protein [Mycolicibacterium vanbaalenii]
MWACVFFLLPINRALPLAPRTLWFAVILLLIAIPIISLRAARPLYPGIWAFAGYASVVAILTSTKTSTIEQNLFVGMQLFILLGFGVFALTASAVTEPKFVERVSGAFLIGQSLSAIAAVLQVLGQSALGAQAVHGRAPGLAGHPNSLGLLSCIAILLALQILVATRKFRVFVIAALSANMLALFASGSLSSFMAVAIGLLVFILCRREHVGKLTIGGIAFAVTLWLVGRFSGIVDYLPSVVQRYRQVTGQTDAESSWEFRMRTYDFAWSKVVEEPFFGNGLNAESSGTFNGITVTHNLVLRGWYQGGAFLAVAFALIVAAVLIVAARAIVRKEHGAEAAILVAIIAFALTSAFFEQRDYWLPLLFAWASISAAQIKLRQVTSPLSLDHQVRKPTPLLRHRSSSSNSTVAAGL